MNTHEPLMHGNYYHIYNRGINSCNLFRDPDNYEHFLRLYDKHIQAIAETYAWVLMPNHFHFLVKIKEKTEICCGKSGLKPENPSKQLHQHFSNLFNAYAKTINKYYLRTGSLFEHPFKRKIITDRDYFRTLVVYIHNNPVHHRFTEKAMDYPWSSYLTCLSLDKTSLQREKVIGWFNSKAEFRILHKSGMDLPADFPFFEQRPSRLVQP